MEGTHAKTIRQDDPPEGSRFIDPIFEYGRQDGISITGGYHYRGKSVPSLKDQYIYADWGFGTIWTLDYREGQEPKNTKIFNRPEKMAKFRPTAFVEDASGEMLILSHNHKIYTISSK